MTMFKAPVSVLITPARVDLAKRTAGQVQNAYSTRHKHVSLLSKDWP